MRDQAAFERRVDDLLHVDVDRRIHVEPPTQQVLEPVRDTLRFEFLDHMANGRRGMNNHAGRAAIIGMGRRITSARRCGVRKPFAAMSVSVWFLRRSTFAASAVGA